MKKASLFLVTVLTALTSLHTYSEESATLTVKSKHWVSKRSFTLRGVDYFLDVYVVDDKNTKPKVRSRNPNDWWKLSGKSEHHHASLSLTGELGDAAKITIPKGKYVYLSSHFRQARGFLVNDIILYCETLIHIKPVADEYLLDLNFVANKAATKLSCSSNVYTPQQYALSHSNFREQTIIDNLSRKELSLSYGDQLAAMFTALEISQQNDYLPVYLDAAVDRLYTIGQSNLKKHEAVAALLKMLTESASNQHITALGNIAKNSQNKYIQKKLKKFLSKKNNETLDLTKAYQPKELKGFDKYTVEQLRILAANENLKSKSRYELEAAARSIMNAPEKYDLAVYDKAADNLRNLAVARDREAPIAAIWMTRTIQASSNKKYVELLSDIEKTATHRKLKGAIQKAIESLNATDKGN